MSSYRTMNYTFEEMPLLQKDGFSAFEISGEATIEYRSPVDFEVVEIFSEGFRRTRHSQAELNEAIRKGVSLPLWETGPRIALDPSSPLFKLIKSALNGHWSDKVQDAVEDQIREDREHEADEYADYRREAMREALP